MPIQFRCPSCDRMLGIARRKAGSTVSCPRCAAAVRVPAMAGMAIESAGPTGGSAIPTVEPVSNGHTPRRAKRQQPGEPPALELENLPLFERPDFESLLSPPPTAKRAEPAKPAAQAPTLLPTEMSVVVTEPPRAKPESSSDVDMVAGLFVSRVWLTAAAVAAAVLIGLAFGAGYWLASVTVARG